MSKIVWDQVGQHWLETGTDRGVLYPMKDDGAYDNGEAWNGLRTYDENPEGAEPQDFYADNILYASLMSAEKFKFSIGCYTYPKSWPKCNGFVEPIEGVMLGQQSRLGFGFACRTLLANDTATESDDKYIIHIVYNATASPSQKSYETKNDSPAAVEMSYDCTSNPVNVTGYKPTSRIDIDTRYLTPEKKKLLEDTLYGVDADAEHNIEASEPTLPTPDELLKLLKN